MFRQQACTGAALCVGFLSVLTGARADDQAPRLVSDSYVGRYNWSGIYAGAHGGWLGPSIESIDAAIFGGPIPTIDPDSGALGFQLGAQVQWDKTVLGIEGGLTAPVGNHRETKDYTGLPGNDTVYRAGIENIWFVGPRIGYAAGNLMPYITGGYASTTVKAQNIQFGIPIVFWDERMDGWFIGGGLDWAISRNWILAIDYRHFEFGSEVNVPTVNGNPAPFDAVRFEPIADSVTLRLSYKFDIWDGSEPLK
jgi:outer membrane immunogenic protein